MNPYTSSTDENQHKKNDYPEDHPLYNFVWKMVIWDEERDEIYRRLEINEITGSCADQLYEHARQDRIRILRKECSRKLFLGIGLIVLVTFIFSVCWIGLGFIPRQLLFLCFAVLAIGLYKFINGLAGYMMAPSKNGSLADHF
jgi:hypothetical protein